MSENVTVPVHVTIIMDGNGRWARQRGGERLMGHRNGVKSVRESCEFAVEKGIKYLSLYAFSEENWSRPKEEVEGLMALMVKSVLEERETFRKNNIRFRVIGHRERLSPELLEKIDEAQAETAGNTGLTLIVMLSYSGKWDLVNAASRYAADACEAVRRGETPPQLDEALFSSYLCTAGIPDPDLLIRTSGEQRISNYMLWQCAYTEFYFTDVLWPDFRKSDFADALDAFSKRDRRYGKIK
ncbi:MAG: di-trans,poly-cis-decaprenylcistransferase [Bacteroidales bacterium]|nr:di-trans,poly-cis-decaprenylcistransferase [Bacteroidales bacterium]